MTYRNKIYTVYCLDFSNFTIFSDMKQGFPWVLAAQYLMAGIGTVIGVLSAALASIALREIQVVMQSHSNSIRSHSNSIRSSSYSIRHKIPAASTSTVMELRNAAFRKHRMDSLLSLKHNTNSVQAELSQVHVFIHIQWGCKSVGSHSSA